MGNTIPHGDRLHECAPDCPEYTSVEGPEEVDEVTEYIITQKQMDAIEHMTEHYAAMLASLAMGARYVPAGEHKHILTDELKHIEEALHDVTSSLFPERHALAMRNREEALKRLNARNN